MWPLVVGISLVTVGIGALIEEYSWKTQCRKNDIPDLPEQPGVYIFYNQRGNINHIGSTSDLFTRVRYHEKKEKMRRFDWKKADSEEEAYKEEQRLQERHNYKGR